MRLSEGWHMVTRDKLLGRLLRMTSLFSKTNSAAFNKSTSFWEREWTYKARLLFPLQENIKQKLLQILLKPTIIMLWSAPNLLLPTAESLVRGRNKTPLGTLGLRKCSESTKRSTGGRKRNTLGSHLMTAAELAWMALHSVVYLIKMRASQVNLASLNMLIVVLSVGHRKLLLHLNAHMQRWYRPSSHSSSSIRTRPLSFRLNWSISTWLVLSSLKRNIFVGNLYKNRYLQWKKT